MFAGRWGGGVQDAVVPSMTADPLRSAANQVYQCETRIDSSQVRKEPMSFRLHRNTSVGVRNFPELEWRGGAVDGFDASTVLTALYCT